ncbi:hypothetical protein BASA81_004057 [Batrachochytrium salamandrivorans]|nr:hypothetical protein BASA81_004057 [Batrachochytrium salamandrivorans]
MAKPTKDHARKQVAGKVEVKKNPFEERSNKKEKHPALNRKIMGANRNVGQARAKAQERREATLLPEFRQRKASSQIEDRRFGESNQTLTREEKMLKRFQALRSNRASKYSLGDGDDDGKSDNTMTHMGQSLSDLLDDGDNVEYEDEGLDDGEDVDVDDLVQRMRNGETFSGSAGKRLTKREAMMDVIRKSKMLKMERQKDKDEDEDERDRLDSMTSNLVQNLAFRPTKAAAFAAAATTGATTTGASDTYDKMVRELTLDPRVVATDRTKTDEELAKEERDRLEALEERRIKRMADESDGGGSDEDDKEDDETNARKRRKRAQIDHALEKEVSTNSDVPFLIECPRSHLELLEFLESYPQADLDQVLVRIRTTNSIHVGNTNRQKLIKLCQVLLDHLQLVGDRACQVLESQQQSKRELAVICKHLFALISLSEKEIASMFFVKLEKAHRLFDLQLRSVRPGSEDLGRERLEFNARPQKMPGGHKDGLSQQLNAGLEHLAKMRRDFELSSSPTRVWPTGGEFALFGAVSALFSTTDFRHPIAMPSALFLGQVLVESPVRGCGDLMCALQTAQLVEKLTRLDGMGGGRFSPEVFCFLRVVLTQLGQKKKPNEGTVHNARCLRLLDQYPAHHHVAFDFIRKPKGTACSLHEAAQSGGAFLQGVVELVENVLSFSIQPDLPCGDLFLRPLVTLMQATQLELFTEVMIKANERIAQVDAGRQKLRMQEFAPVVKASSMDPKLGNNVRPGEVERTLKRKVKEERKGVSRELRLDGQFLANAAQREKREKLQSVRSARQRNFADLQTQQAGFNQMVKSGFAVKGAGVGGLNLKGRRMGKKQVEE